MAENRRHQVVDLPHESDESHTSQTQGTQENQEKMKRAMRDLNEGQVDTEARGTGGADEINKQTGQRGAEAAGRPGGVPASDAKMTGKQP